MAEYADLEIGLHRWDANNYAVELRFAAAASDTDVPPVRGRVSFDPSAVRSRELDPTAYGRLLPQNLTLTERTIAGFAVRKEMRPERESAEQRLLVEIIASLQALLQHRGTEDLRSPLRVTLENLLPRASLIALADSQGQLLFSNPAFAALAAEVPASLGSILRGLPPGRHRMVPVLLDVTGKTATYDVVRTDIPDERTHQLQGCLYQAEPAGASAPPSETLVEIHRLVTAMTTLATLIQYAAPDQAAAYREALTGSVEQLAALSAPS